MSHFEIRTAGDGPDVGVLADDELAALDRAIEADLLHDGDEGNVEAVEDEAVEGYEPEGPG